MFKAQRIKCERQTESTHQGEEKSLLMILGYKKKMKNNV